MCSVSVFGATKTIDKNKKAVLSQRRPRDAPNLGEEEVAGGRGWYHSKER